jgi:DNA-directed RNA polymerase subunit beta'
VAELFEARRHKEPSIITEIDGIIKFGSLKRGVRELIVTSTTTKMQKRYLIPYGKHILVHDGDFVRAGERLSEGSIAPQDILNILGPGKVQEYLVNEIQEVYRLQGVRINDKHIEVIVRQMMQKVRIEDPGDTDYLEGDQVDRFELQDVNAKISRKAVVEDPGDSKFTAGDLVERMIISRDNRKLRNQGLREVATRLARPAIFKPILLGITQAALSTNSFISAASFQETTRVLTDAAIEHKTDILQGLKENVIMGHLIPAGTGLTKFQSLRVHKKMPTKPETEVVPITSEVTATTEETKILLENSSENKELVSAHNSIDSNKLSE